MLDSTVTCTIKIKILKSSIRPLGGEGQGVVIEEGTVTTGSSTWFAAMCDASPSRKAAQIKNHYTRLTVSVLSYLHLWTVDYVQRK